MTSGLDMLRAEHQVILGAIRLFHAICAAIENGKTVPHAHLEFIIQFINKYVDQVHHFKEEKILLPYLTHATSSKKIRDFEEIIDEHLMQRAYLNKMSIEIKNQKNFTSQTRSFIGHLCEHILKEDAYLLTKADRLLSQEMKNEIINKFLAIDQNPKTIEKITAITNAIKDLNLIYLNKQPEDDLQNHLPTSMESIV